MTPQTPSPLPGSLAQVDPEVLAMIDGETRRLRETIQLIPSENYPSQAVMEATGSVFTTKYAEGYPKRRYYQGCQWVDAVEELARKRACTLFGADHANVQPHSGSSANMGVYLASLNYGDTVMGLDLIAGGHLTHGSPVNFSAKLYKFVAYGVDPETELIDFDQVRDVARANRPKMIVVGATAYPRTFDWATFKEVADEVGALLLADIAHISGLIAGGAHPSPVPFADFCSTSTHKALRGPRGGMILCKSEWAERIDKAIMPGLQGGPLEHVIAAKAVAFGEALQPAFVDYSQRVVANAQALAGRLQERGIGVVSGGTDNHIVLLDLRSIGLTGKVADALVSEINITANKNTIPFDPESPFVTSGLRLGSAAMTTRGFDGAAFIEVADIIADRLLLPGDGAVAQRCRERVDALCTRFPLYAPVRALQPA